jgi:hypothetical protein
VVLVMADPLANLKANFESIKADFESLISNFKSQLARNNDHQPSAKINALRPNWSTK